MPLTLPNLQVKLASIPGISWPIKKLATRDNGVAVGMSEFPSSPTEVEGSMLKSNVGVAPLKAVPGYEDGFVNFIASLFAKPSHTFAIGGNVDIWYKVPSLSSGSESNGADSSKTLTATNIGISAPVTVRGLDNLQRVEHVKLESLTKDADSGVTTLVHTINVHNPSELSIKMGDLVFNLINADEDVKGTITLLNVNLARGDNFMRATTTFTDSDIYDSLTSESNTFTFAGFKGTAKHLVSDAVLSAYRSHLTIPKFEAA
ncbi:hypothetical protein BX616_006065 [Lobosporangium transversale]|nr:hypothetical protein BX616_006065 [Lobosporangium transversale]